MAPPLADSPLLLACLQDGAEPHPDPRVQRREGRLAAVLEVLEPASQHGIEAFDDGGEAVAIATPGEPADSVLEALQALVARLSAPAFEAVAEEIEAILTDDDETFLFVLQGERIKNPCSFFFVS